MQNCGAYFSILSLLVVNIYGDGSCAKRQITGDTPCCKEREKTCYGHESKLLDTDNRCYCDEACLGLNDCCFDYRTQCIRTVNEQPCLVKYGFWQEWSICNAACGKGVQIRSRINTGNGNCPKKSHQRQRRRCVQINKCLRVQETALILRESNGSRGKLPYYHVKEDYPKNQYCNIFKISRATPGCYLVNNRVPLRKLCVKCQAPAMKNGTSKGAIEASRGKWQMMKLTHNGSAVCEGRWINHHRKLLCNKCSSFSAAEKFIYL